MYSDVLEHSEYTAILPQTVSHEPVVTHLQSNAATTFAVSLSGGVDSMVIASALRMMNYEVICLHINYNNREESGKEAEFLEKWTTENGMNFKYRNIKGLVRCDSNRKEYEESTKKIRFEFYQSVLEDSDATSIMLGHHDDDIIENVVNNLFRGRNILDLTVMEKEDCMFGVCISRPLIGLRKSQVYEFAKKYKIPYFKDTTPYWSLRGIFRQQLLPILEQTYKGACKNILSISKQSDEWNSFIRSHVVEPYLLQVDFQDNYATLPLTDYKTYPECFWRHVLSIIFHKYSQSCPSGKSIKNFVSKFSNPTKVMLTNSTYAEMLDSYAVIVFRSE
jgi:tRNA(Ile)-lysidine synthetase-like protein